MKFVTILFCSAALAFADGPSKIKSDETVMIYPAAGWQETSVENRIAWRVPIQLRVFEQRSSLLFSGLFQTVFGLDAKEMTAGERRLYNQRLGLFLADNQSQKRVLLKVGAHEVLMPATQQNGWAETNLLIELPASVGPQTLPVQVAPELTDGRSFTGAVFLLAPTGYLVISDIDDTIKISNVADRKELLKNTLCRPFKPVPGMAGLYRSWQRTNVCFFYLSASSWQLFEPLREFIQTHGFPYGPFHMKRWSLTDHGFSELWKSPEIYKRQALDEIISRFPRLQLVLVGDTGEKDPEVYGALAREHPDKVRRIYLRNVTGESAESPRIQSALREVMKERWRLFDKPEELASDIWNR